MSKLLLWKDISVSGKDFSKGHAVWCKIMMNVLKEQYDTSVSYKSGLWWQVGVTKKCTKRDEITRRIIKQGYRNDSWVARHGKVSVSYLHKLLEYFKKQL